jgi:hypothetical protein
MRLSVGHSHASSHPLGQKDPPIAWISKWMPGSGAADTGTLPVAIPKSNVIVEISTVWPGEASAVSGQGATRRSASLPFKDCDVG